MAIIPGDMRIVWLSPAVDLTERRTNKVNSESEAYTMSDIVETVSGEIPTDYTLIETLTLGSSRSLILTDRDKNIENTADITISVPSNASVEFPIGTQIFFTKKAESLTIIPDIVVNINSVDGLLELGRINCGATLLKIGTDEWNLIGELV